MSAVSMTAASSARARGAEAGPRAASRDLATPPTPEQADQSAGRALMAILCLGTLLWAVAFAMLVL